MRRASPGTQRLGCDPFPGSLASRPGGIMEDQHKILQGSRKNGRRLTQQGASFSPKIRHCLPPFESGAGTEILGVCLCRMTMAPKPLIWPLFLTNTYRLQEALGFEG